MKDIFFQNPTFGPDPFRRKMLEQFDRQQQADEVDWKLWDLAMQFHVESEHFDRQHSDATNERGVAIPTRYRRECETNARRLLESIFNESIRYKYDLGFGEWSKLTKDVTHQFESLLQQGWMDKNAAIKRHDGELVFVQRDQFASGYRLDTVLDAAGTHRVITYKASGKFIVRHGACAEIFEPSN